MAQTLFRHRHIIFPVCIFLCLICFGFFVPVKRNKVAFELFTVIFVSVFYPFITTTCKEKCGHSTPCGVCGCSSLSDTACIPE